MRYLAHGEETSQQALNRAAVTVEQAEALAQRLADKPYARRKKPEPEKTMSDEQSLLVKACLSQ